MADHIVTTPRDQNPAGGRVTVELHRRKATGDGATFGNTVGGVIILGIEEDDQACATQTPG